MNAFDKTRIYVGLFVATALVLWGGPLADIALSLWQPGYGAIAQSDFANYWLAGKLAVEGNTELLYVQRSYFAQMQEIFGSDIEVRAWSYPPHALLFLWPLGLLSYKSALLAFLGSGLFLYWLASSSALKIIGVRRFGLLFMAALMPFVLMQTATMQNGFHLGALAVLGLVLMKRRPEIAGLCFAILTVKPQLGILIPFLMIFVGAWRCIFWSCFFAVLLVWFSIGIFGLQDWLDYLQHTVPYQARVMHDWYGPFLEMMPGTFASMRVLGFDALTAQNIHFVVLAILLPVVIWMLFSRTSRTSRMFILLVGTFLITPYSFMYDMGAFSIIGAALMTRRLDEGSSSAAVFATAAAWPSMIMASGSLGLPITPILLLALLFFMRLQTQNSKKLAII